MFYIMHERGKGKYNIYAIVILLCYALARDLLLCLISIDILYKIEGM